MLNEVHKIVRSLDKRELTIIRRHLITAKSNNNYLLLLNALRESEAVDLESIKIKVHAEASLKTFQKLVIRFRKKLNDGLNLDAIILEDKDRPSQFQMKYVLRKNLTVAEMLIKKGLDEIALTDLESIETKASQYELFNIQYEAACLRSFLLAQAQGYSAYKRMEGARGNALERFTALQLVDDEYLKLLDYTQFHSKTNFTLDDIRAGVLRLNELYLTTGSEEVYYYYVRLQAFLLECNGEYLEIITRIKHLFEHWKKNPSVESKLRRGILHLMIADASIEIGLHEEAIAEANACCECFVEKHFNSVLSLEYRFFAEFYSGNLRSARSSINKALRNTDEKTFKFDFAKRHYYKDCLRFLSETKRPIPNSLYTSTILDTHAEDFSFYIRLLIIMNQIELKNLESADDGIENLNQFMRYHLKREAKFSARIKGIFRMLILLKKSSYSFAFTDENTLLHNQLSGDDPEFRWINRSPELVRFHDWFKARSLEISYREYITAR